MGLVRSSRPVPGYGSGISASTSVPLRQASLAWPGIEETCPKCHGKRHVYYLHAGQPGVEIVGGKRVPARSVPAQAACAPRFAARQIPPIEPTADGAADLPSRMRQTLRVSALEDYTA